MTIAAIETVYKGYKFRSRLEARWAYFLDLLGIRWEYEHEKYQLSSGVRYIPDFWLPDHHTILEIKGTRPTSDQIQKCEELSDSGGCITVIAWGLPQRWTSNIKDTNYQGMMVNGYCDTSYGVCACWDKDCAWIFGEDKKPGIYSIHFNSEAQFYICDENSMADIDLFKNRHNFGYTIPRNFIDKVKQVRFEDLGRQVDLFE